MRFLIVSPTFPPAYAYGGPPRAVYHLALGLKEIGHEVLVLTSNGNVSRDLDVPTDVDTDVDGITVRYLRRFNRSAFHLVPSLIPALHTEARKFDIALVRGHWTFFNLAASQVLNAVNVPYVIYPEGTLHTYALSLTPWKKRCYWHAVEKRNYSRATGIIALSPHEGRRVRAMGCTAPMAIIPNCVSQPDGQTAFASIQPPHAPRCILYVGRIHRIKGLDVLIRAFAEIRRSEPTLELHLVGPVDDQAYARHLQRLISDEQLTGSVHFTGLLLGSELAAAYASASVFVLPSHSEGCPLSALEAMAAGLPVVVSTECDLPLIQQRGAGFAVKATPGQLATSIQSILSNTDQAVSMGEAGKKLIHDMYSRSRSAHCTAEFCDQLLSGRAPTQSSPTQALH